jgi:DNA repair exonuclease SbcCD ATPase subunit
VIIRRLKVKNWTVHRDLELELKPGLVGIQGQNGAGKSTILDALRFGITGESVGDGVKADNLTWGEKSGFVEIEFTRDSQTYVVRRAIEQAKQIFKAKDEDPLTRKDEIEKYIEEIAGSSIDTLLNNIFVAQNHIDAILYKSNTERLKEFINTFGLERAQEALKVVSIEFNNIEITPDLERELDLSRTVVRDTIIELDLARNQLKPVQSLIDTLTAKTHKLLAYNEQLKRKKLADSLSEKISKETETFADLSIRENQLKSQINDSSKALEESKSLYDNAIAVIAAKRAYSQNMAQRANLLKTRDDNLAILAGVTEPSEELIIELTNQINEFRIQKDRFLGFINSPDTAPKTAKHSSAIERLAQAKQNLNSIKLTKSEELITLESEYKQLEPKLPILKAGSCHTCGQSIPEELYISKINEFNGIKTKIDSMKSTELEIYNSKTTELKTLIQDLTAEVFTHLESTKALAQKRLDDVNSKLSISAAKLEEYKLIKSKCQAARSAVELAESALKDGVSFDIEESVVNDYEELISRYQRMQTSLQEMKSQYSITSQALILSSSRLDELNKELNQVSVDLLDITPEELEDLSQASEQLLPANKQYKELTIRIGSLEGRLIQYEGIVNKLEEQLSKELKLKKLHNILGMVRDVLHPTMLPKRVLQEYATLINRRIHYYLQIWEAPFRVYLDDNLAFLAEYPDGKTHPAARLSGGQKIVASISFRLAMADTFAKDVGILILDEPSNHLDKDNITHLQNLLLRLKELTGSTGKQIIIVTHEEQLSGFFDHVVKLYT